MNNIYPDGIDIANEVEEFVRSAASGSVSKRGDEFVFSSCPFCDGGKSHDKNTFSINRKTGQYQCKRSNCNAIGNLWTLSKDKDIAYSLPEPERKKSRNKDTLPLKMDINLFDDSDEDSKQVQMLRTRISKLGPFDRAIVLLWLENLSYDEIGAIVGISAKNVSVRLVRIKDQLKKMSNE